MESLPRLLLVFVLFSPQKIALLHELKTKILESQAESTKENSPPKKSLHAAPALRMSHRRNLSYGGSLPQTEDDFVQRFSVFYVGKVTISQAKAPPKFVDEMLRHIKLMEVEHKRKKSNHMEKNSDEIIGNTKHSSSGKIIDLCGIGQTSICFGVMFCLLISLKIAIFVTEPYSQLTECLN